MKSFMDLLQALNSSTNLQMDRDIGTTIGTSTYKYLVLPSILRYYYGKRGSKHSRESLSDNMINVPQLLISWLYGFNEINHCVLVTTAACCLPF